MFRYSEGALFCESVPLRAIAEQAGTPCYVYSANSLRHAYRAYDRAFGSIPHRVCYAVKANSNLAVLNVLAREGAGFDIVSAGELFRVLKAGGDPSRLVFSGVGKTAKEIEFALKQGIHSFNCESEPELALLDRIAADLQMTARFALRINPDVNAATHPYISTGLTEHKFGIDIRQAEEIYARSFAFRSLAAEGISCHIGSQILDPAPMIEAAQKVLALATRLRAGGHPLRHLDLGGGLGIAYRAEEESPPIEDFIERLSKPLRESGFELMVEPGRSVVGRAGVLLTQVLFRKRNGNKEFAVVDAAMNDLIRPALYQSHHEILPLIEGGRVAIMDVVGPVCETGDFLARGREVAGAEQGAFFAIATAGAYGFAQSSNYNSRPRAAEVMVDGDAWRVVRNRETLDDLVRGECI